MPELSLQPELPSLVLDTNIVLDLFIFADPQTNVLRAALEARALRWIATHAMREELQRVLAYPQIAQRMAFYQIEAAQVLARFDALAHPGAVPPRASYVCKDADDQKFIDLAVAHRALLISKDKAVLSMAKRLRRLGVLTTSCFVAVLPESPVKIEFDQTG